MLKKILVVDDERHIVRLVKRAWRALAIFMTRRRESPIRTKSWCS